MILFKPITKYKVSKTFETFQAANTATRNLFMLNKREIMIESSDTVPAFLSRTWVSYCE